MPQRELSLRSVGSYAPMNSSQAHDSVDGALRQWSSKYLEAMSHLGKDPRVGMRLGSMLTAAGFVNVEETSFELPMCDWPTGRKPRHSETIANSKRSTEPREQQIGAWNQPNVSELLHSLALWPLTSRRGLRYIHWRQYWPNSAADANNYPECRLRRSTSSSQMPELMPVIHYSR